MHDIEYVKTLTRRLLQKLEIAFDSEPECGKPPPDRLFGIKLSLAEILVMLAELMLKLDKADKPTVADDAPEPIPAFQPADIALVEAFISKAKNL